MTHPSSLHDEEHDAIRFFGEEMKNDLNATLARMLWLPAVYIVGFGILLLTVWPRLDDTAVIGVVSVLAGGLAGVVGSFVGAMIAVKRVDKESETKLKQYASEQALELTKLEVELRRSEGRQKKLLAVAKIYREFYKALFELYETRTWPKAIEEQGLINIYDFGGKKDPPDRTDRLS